MITACHPLIYSDDASATREFFRDVTVAVPGADDLMLYQPKHELALDA